MNRNLLVYCFFFFTCYTLFPQTKVSGKVIDETGEPIAFANVMFKDSSVGAITNDDGSFYLESDDTYTYLIVSLLGFATQEIELTKKVTYELAVTLSEGEQLKEVVIYAGKQSKKNNPAIDILRKIWAKEKNNGLHKYQQYAYDKYEKIEFDLNTIDSAMINSKLFKGMEFIFEYADTSNITGKTYLPVFINETVYEVYGDNNLNEEKEILKGSQNSGFSSNQSITASIQDLYSEYDIYDNYLTFFDKNFTSPLSKTGINTYNYVLTDSAFIDNKWCYNIVYYPRRKNELTFKGDFWVTDSTFAIKEINMQVTRSANINWVKDIYIEQEFEVVDDSTILLTRDYMMSDFALNKKEKSKGIYGKRTTIYDHYVFDQEKPKSFYDTQVDPYNEAVYNRDDSFWENRRLEQLNKDEQQVYSMLDTLKTVPKFKTMYNLVSILGSGYIEFDKYNFDFGPIYSSFGYNAVEGVRLRAGGRTYFGQNDQWRIEGYTAYGFKDDKFKYGISGKYLLDRKMRLIISGGNRRDVEQLGVSLTETNDVLGRSFASSSVFTAGANNTLSNINLSTFGIEIEPYKNVKFKINVSYRTISSALPDDFNLSYLDPNSPTGIEDETKQFGVSTSVEFTPGRKTLGYGVERKEVDDDYGRYFLQYTSGIKGMLDSDFDYQKLQFYYQQPVNIGSIGRLTTTVEAGKTFGEVPLSLLSVIPGNQTYFSIFNTFPNLDFYEFVTDTYLSGHLEHNFNGKIFSRIPLLRKLNLREIVGVRGVWGEISDANIALNAPAADFLNAPDSKPYWEYSVGVGNIFKVFRLDFNFRGNYLENPGARKFSVTGAFGFYF
ncbi:CarboxypepD_reg-like domain-containing protein [Pustulibacterium marinum]|uniref:CarboxypepD_reg-like domain-containing protein n=1 Tax=Pustulibacterium marinum TaxID=1224947 RepID=A0A1I7GQA5_9FLAO|nr:DUF5686 and carboxypeptidase-like regulatory domain-containing protein [Pustulibacterium marinum]SFU50416.1 CarboxypepD_reg-like domain-containing protein [Pustulibacterium marinum]